MHGVGEAGPVHAVRRARIVERGQVHRAEVAGLVGEQRLFAARIGRFDGPKGRGGVVPVDAVDKDDARIAGFPGLAHKQREHLAGVLLAGHGPVPGIDQGVVLAFFHGLHEAFGQGHGDVEIGQLVFAFLAGDEFQNVRVVHAQDAHVGPAPGAALFDLLGGGIENAHERHRPRSHAAGRADPAFFRAQARKGKARAAAGLVDERRVLHGVEDLLHGIAHGQHEAGRQLPKGRAGVHEGGGVGQEPAVGHKAVKTPCQVLHGKGRLVVLGFLAGNGRGHPPEKPPDILHGLAVRAFLQVALGQDHLGVGVDGSLGQIGGQGQCGHGMSCIGVLEKKVAAQGGCLKIV